MGMRRNEIKSKLEEIIDFAGILKYIDTPIKRFSSGMQVRLGFAIAAFLEPEILIVDEVLAVGDAEFQKKAIGKMQDVSKGEWIRGPLFLKEMFLKQLTDIWILDLNLSFLSAKPQMKVLTFLFKRLRFLILTTNFVRNLPVKKISKFLLTLK